MYELDREVYDRAKSYVADDYPVGAMKAIRNDTGYGLKIAKHIVNNMCKGTESDVVTIIEPAISIGRRFTNLFTGA